jgi:hypothetical protein
MAPTRYFANIGEFGNTQKIDVHFKVGSSNFILDPSSSSMTQKFHVTLVVGSRILSISKNYFNHLQFYMESKIPKKPVSGSSLVIGSVERKYD